MMIIKFLKFLFSKDAAAQNDAMTVKWLQRAAEQGDAYAKNNLEIMYSYGRGVPPKQI